MRRSRNLTLNVTCPECVVVVTDEAVSRIVKPEALRNAILRRRVAFIPDSVWTALMPADA